MNGNEYSPGYSPSGGVGYEYSPTGSQYGSDASPDTSPYTAMTEHSPAGAGSTGGDMNAPGLRKVYSFMPEKAFNSSTGSLHSMAASASQLGQTQSTNNSGTPSGVSAVASINVDHHGDDSESEASEDDWMVDGASDDDMSGGSDND